MQLVPLGTFTSTRRVVGSFTPRAVVPSLVPALPLLFGGSAFATLPFVSTAA